MASLRDATPTATFYPLSFSLMITPLSCFTINKEKKDFQASIFFREEEEERIQDPSFKLQSFSEKKKKKKEFRNPSLL